MKKIYGFIVFFLFPLLLFAQNVSLYHSGTQFDTFENPVQQGFQKDFSRKYAVTLLPHINGFINFKGDGESAFKKLLFTRSFANTNVGNLGEARQNQLNGNANIYLANYRIFRTRNYNRELGFSLQLKEEGQGIFTNETITLLDSYKKFSQNEYDNAFNTDSYNQAYWQLGVSYRENYNDRWAFGAKVSLLNGLIYNKADISSSHLSINPNNSYTASVTGNYISSFGFDKLNFDKLVPNLKNMGAAISVASSYQTKSGYYLTVNLKDAGFIHWSKNTDNYTFDSNITVFNPDSANASARLFNGLKEDANSTEVKKSFYSKINTKIEFATSKEFGFYKPVFVASKSIFNPQGQFALINNLKKNAFVFSANAIYDLQTKLNFGSQIMVKSANMEFYLGSEQIFPTYYLSKSYFTKDENIGKSNPRAGFYIGINVKFGPKMQNIGTAEEIPGLNDKETGYVVRLSKKERKRLQKQNKKIDKNRRANDKRNNRR
ncbi:MAG TPA: DUF5723 family protein [Pelobium sp.]|nr:DUF5723 family protein [Pelobium sp.]